MVVGSSTAFSKSAWRAATRARAGMSCRRKVRRSRAFLEAIDISSTSPRRTLTIRAQPLQPLAPIARHGGRPHEIPPFEQIIVPSTGAPPKSRHIALQARLNSNDMAQGKGGATAGGAVSHISEEEHTCDTAESQPDILCMKLPMTYINCLLMAARNQMRWCQSSSERFENDMWTDQAGTLASFVLNP
jgi:hypothetical protein